MRILVAGGLEPPDARIIADCLVDADLRGVDTHGVARLPQYLSSIRAGAINPRPQVRVLRNTGAVALVDADGGYGFGPALLAMDLAVEAARNLGVGVAGVRNSRHFGMAASYPLRAAAAGFIGLATTTSSALLPPPGGTRAVVGNNPIACAVPRRTPAPPIVLDMALSQAAFGRIRLAAAEGRPIPSGWAYDSAGRPTTDAAEALAARVLTAIGGHKGYGLSVMVELLAGALTRSAVGDRGDVHGPGGVASSHLLAALDPAAFLDVDEFLVRVEDLVDQIKAVPLAERARAVYLPGEPETLRQQERERLGIPIPAELGRRLATLAAELGVTPPIPV